MAFTQEDKDKMDVAAGEADDELNGMIDGLHLPTSTPEDMLKGIANWWNRWYPHAGHKRLARILLQYTSKEDTP